tara:strand:- start:2595 stop:3062 length:468 start_codon:yes stop_codon:yes gene_type:complete
MKEYFSIQSLNNVIKNERKKNKIIGFTNGCFDLLHLGHLHLLKKASKACDFLIVAVNSDKSIRSIKGLSRPIQKQNTRIINLLKISYINALILFEDDTPIELINYLLPDILFKGSDYLNKEIVGDEIIQKNGGKVVLIDLLEGFSTTNIINKFGN